MSDGRGCEEAYLIYEAAWYEAMQTLHDITEFAETPQRIEAAKAILDYGKQFTVLGAPFIPSTTPEILRSKEEEDDSKE